MTPSLSLIGYLAISYASVESYTLVITYGPLNLGLNLLLARFPWNKDLYATLSPRLSGENFSAGDFQYCRKQGFPLAHECCCCTKKSLGIDLIAECQVLLYFTTTCGSCKSQSVGFC